MRINFKLIITILIWSIYFIQLNLAVCTQRFCGVKGAQCGDFQKGCAPNFYCNGGICVDGKVEDERCNNNRECALGFKCVNHGQFRVCKSAKYQGLGDKCSAATDCLGSLQCARGQCHLKKGGNCTVTEDCEPTSYCNKINQCVPRLVLGSDCVFQEDQCTHDAICGSQDNYENYLQGKCIPLFSKKSGESCFAPQYGECDQTDGLYCPASSGATSTCTVMYDRRKICHSNSDCDSFWQTCECDGTIKNSTCHSKFNIDETCSRLYESLQSCLLDHSCSVVQDINGIHETSSDSCVIKNCQQPAVCFYSRCLRHEFGGCELPKEFKCLNDYATANHTLDTRIGNYTDLALNGIDADKLTTKPKSLDSTGNSLDSTNVTNDSPDIKNGDDKNGADKNNGENHDNSATTISLINSSILFLSLTSVLLSIF